MNETRKKRIEKRIQRLIADLIYRRLKNPNIGFVTITGCEMASDGSMVTVSVSVYDEPENRPVSIKALNSSAGYIRSRIAENIRMRLIPKVVFILDESLDKAEEIEGILDHQKDDGEGDPGDESHSDTDQNGDADSGE